MGDALRLNAAGRAAFPGFLQRHRQVCFLHGGVPRGATVRAQTEAGGETRARKPERDVHREAHGRRWTPLPSHRVPPGTATSEESMI